MKTLFTFFIFSILAFSLKAQWVELDPGVDVPYFSDVYAITPDTVVVVGADGTILKTTDGGETWIQKESGTTENLRKVQFPTPEVGYIIGNNGTLLKTTDDGETWNLVGVGNNCYLYDFSCVNENLIFITCSGNLMKSEDGGDSWSQVGPAFWEKMQFLNDNIGYASQNSGDFYFLKTIDGGVSWQESNSFYPFYFLNENIGFGVYGSLFKTIDEGNTFVQIGESEIDTFEDIFAVNENIIWGFLPRLLNGDGSTTGVIKITGNSSDNYTEELWYDNNPEIDMASIHFANETTGYIAGYKNEKGAIWKNGTGINTMETKETEKNNEIKVYPNPASKEINIAFNDSFSGVISLSDLTGKQVYSSNIQNRYNITINVEKFSKGIFVLSLKTKQGNFSQKIIIN